ncbi:rRNA maturation RNase YbeY [[Mycoplasma] gypis]|uniref:Endoribonuclease YbeY n=1 Tax=[Mycoplasma] gypis TaxID=92404 RepID=A0ABZ2RMD8_9BACT|nr:rRNA maturation RNase YbeY [[Mycoplasma] gypis]MBN0919130.1 rRNA maturation RNase YbeY [[Mycoplasma] gypis]
MKNEIIFTNQTKYDFQFLELFNQILDEAQKVFNSKKNLSVDLLLTNNEKMQKFNKKYRKKDYPTDILSFPFEEDELIKILDVRPLGQIIMSWEKIESQAVEYGHSIKREFSYIFAHGIAHLFGFDHQTEEEEKEMNSYVDQIMNNLGITRE